MKLELFLIAMASMALFAIGDILSAAWGKTGRWWWLVGMLITGNLAWVLFAHLNKYWPLAVVGAFVSMGLVASSTLAGWLIFGERLVPVEKLALVIGLVSLSLFAYARLPDSKPAAQPPPIEERQP